MKTHTICISCTIASKDNWGGSIEGQFLPPNGDAWEGYWHPSRGVYFWVMLTHLRSTLI